MKSNHLKPELYITDFEKSIDFSHNILGFTIEYRKENPSFALLSYQGSHIMIQEIDPNEDKAFITGDFEYPFGRGINFQIDTNNIQQINNSLKGRNYPLRRAIQDSWYKVGNVLRGCRQVLVQDPDGYLLRFSKDIGEKPVNTSHL